MTKRIKKIINMSFLIVFLLGYIGTIVPGSVVASLLDIKVYAEGEEEEEGPTTSTLDQVSLVNENITFTIDSNETLTTDWTDSAVFEESMQYEITNMYWENENGEEIFEGSPLNSSRELYLRMEIMARYDDIEDVQYQFNQEMSTNDVTLNGEDAYEISIDGEDIITVSFKVDVISNNEVLEVDKIKIDSATLDYLANETPSITARSLETSYYYVHSEIFTNVANGVELGLTDPFEAGNTYSYTIKIGEENAEVATIQNATKIVINDTEYDLVFEGENKNASFEDGLLVFTGVENIVIPAAQVQKKEIEVLNYTGYNNGTFTFNNGSAYVKVNGEKFTGDLNTNGKIEVEGEFANIEVVATPNSGYVSTVLINGVETNTSSISSNSTINIEFNLEPVVPTNLNVEIIGFDNYTNGDFIFKSGSANIYINNEKYTGELNDGSIIVIEGANADIRVEATPNVGYTARVFINGSEINSKTITGDAHIEFEFEKLQYKVDFNSNGGSNINSLNNVEYGTELNLNEYIPTRTDYVFDGWFLNENDTEAVTSITVTSNITLIAKWTSLKGDIAITTNSLEGIEDITLNGVRVENNVGYGYLDNTHKNTFVFTPPYLEGYTIMSIKITDQEGNIVNGGPGEKDGEVTVEVNGSSSYNIEIDVEKSAPSVLEYNITYDLTGIKTDDNRTKINNAEGLDATLSIDPAYEVESFVTGYVMPENITVTINGSETENYTYNHETGELSIAPYDVTGDVVITAHSIGLVEIPTIKVNKFTYDGNIHTVELNNFNEELVQTSGVSSASDASNYTLKFDLKDEYHVWADTTTTQKSSNWEIEKANLTLSVRMDGWLVTSEPANPVVTGNVSNGAETFEYKVKGSDDSTYTTQKPTSVGEYVVRYTVGETDNYNGGSATAEFKVTEGVVIVDLPLLKTKNIVYTGYEITIDDIYSDQLINRFNAKATEVGTYTTRYSLMNSNYKWADGTTEDKILEWNIVLGKPEVNTSYNYNSIKLTWDEVAGADKYQVYECDSKDDSCKKLTTTSDTLYTHKKLKLNSKHYYKVRAYREIDGTKVYSDYTDLMKVTAKLNTPELTSSINRYQEIKLSWNKIDGAEKYYVYRCNASGGSCKEIKSLTKTSYSDKSTKEEVTYTYKVRAYRAKKYSSYSNLEEGYRLNDDLTVKIKNVAYLTNRIIINDKEGATKYQIYSSTDNKKFTLLETIEADGEDVEYYHTGLKFNKKYYYKVRAHNGVNYTAYVLKDATTKYLDKPEVTASTNMYQQVLLSWDKVQGAEKYYIYTCNSKGEKCKELANTKSLTYKDKKATEGKTTYYRVKTYKAKKYSGYSDVVEGYRLNDDISYKVKNNDYLTNTITIQDKEDALYFEIYKSVDDKTYNLVETLNTTGEAVTYIDTDLKYNKKYYYKVRAHNGVNYTAYVEKNITTTKLATPNGFVSNDGTKVTIEIDAVSKATGYEYDYSTDGSTWKNAKTTSSLKYSKSFKEGTYYFRVRAYRVDGKKTYYGSYYYSDAVELY